MATPERPAEEPIAKAFRGRAAPVILGAIAAAYLALVWLEAVRTGVTASRLGLPQPLVYFTQVAGLFPRAAKHAVEYRAEALLCGEREWIEIDVRPFFPIDADNKE